MTAYLLDTNLISELIKRQPSASVLERVQAVPRGKLYSSAICVMELRFGTARHPRGAQLWKRIHAEVLSKLSVLPVASQEASRAGELLARLETAGEPIGIEDVLIGATALVHELTLVTRNTKHFSRIEGLKIENWWNSPSH